MHARSGQSLYRFNWTIETEWRFCIAYLAQISLVYDISVSQGLQKLFKGVQVSDTKEGLNLCLYDV